VISVKTRKRFHRFWPEIDGLRVGFAVKGFGCSAFLNFREMTKCREGREEIRRF